MNPTIIRMLFTGVFALSGLGLAGAIELTGGDTPGWLIAITAAATAYLFGHVRANGFDGKKNK